MANILVTGASRGIGFEAVLALVMHAEHKVMAVSRSSKGLEQLGQLARQLNPACQLKTLALDLLDEGGDANLADHVRQFFSEGLDILINNAGKLIRKPFMDLAIREFRDLLEINFLTPARLIQLLVPLFKPSGGHVVNLGSMGGFQGSLKFSGLAAYSTSKAALHSLTECLAEELKIHQIQVNCLALGAVQTEMLDESFPGYKAPVLAYEMGEYVAHFALTGHKFYNGKVVPVATTTP